MQLFVVITRGVLTPLSQRQNQQGGRDSNEPPVPPADPPLRRTLLFLYIIPNLILNDGFNISQR